ncbi:hypothetical protein TRVL_02838 [Trypanosoma vivax]|nr:hypothetical protein TRVL_02838 [Trypanosoma vivax]
MAKAVPFACVQSGCEAHAYHQGINHCMRLVKGPPETCSASFLSSFQFFMNHYSLAVPQKLGHMSPSQQFCGSTKCRVCTESVEWSSCVRRHSTMFCALYLVIFPSSVFPLTIFSYIFYE